MHPNQAKGLFNLNEIKIIYIAVVYQIKATQEEREDKCTSRPPR